MKNYILKIVYLLFLVIWPGIIHADAPEVRAVPVVGCPGETLVDIDITGIGSLGSISLVINFNQGVLAYEDYQDVHPALMDGTMIVNATGSSVVIAWAHQAGATLEDGTLMTLRFTSTPGSSPLNWDTATPGNCELSDADGNLLPVTFVNGTATIRQHPHIISQTASRTVLIGQNASFNVNAIAHSISYQWFRSTDGGETWTSLTNSGPYTGATASTLNISNIPLSFDGHLYKCRISGTCPPEVFSEPAPLNVIRPLITSFEAPDICPGNITVPVIADYFNEIAGFSLSFNYDPSNMTFVGYEGLNDHLAGGTFVCNAHEGTLYMSWASTGAVTLADDAVLVELLFEAATGPANFNWNTDLAGHCEYVDIDGNEAVTVFHNKSFTVFLAPTITGHPANKLIAELTNTTMSVGAQASGIAYRWQVSTDGGSTFTNLANTGHYSGVTTANLAISNVSLALNGNLYRSVVSGNCSPQAVSDAALLRVLPKITTTASNATACPDQSLIVPVTVQRFINVASFSLSFAYDPDVLSFEGHQELNEELANGSFFSNASNGIAYITWFSTNAATIGDGLLVELLFSGVPGSSALTWQSQAAGQCEYSDPDGLSIFTNFINGNATIHQPPVITAQPSDKTIYSGGSVTFSVTAAGMSLAYRWQVSTNGGNSWSDVSGTPYSGTTTRNLTINPANESLNGNMYRCRVSGTCQPVAYSNVVTLSVTQAAVVTTAGSAINSCSGNLDIPVTVSNVHNVGGISLVLEFDESKLTFAGYHSLHPALTGGMLVINQVGNKVYLSWASLNPADFGSGTLVRYRFTAHGQTSSTPLSWDTQTSGNCEYSDINGLQITSFYNNGTVSVIANPLIVDAGDDAEIHQGGQAQLNATVNGGFEPYSYLWTPEKGLDDAQVLNPIASPNESTKYRLTVTAANHCVAWDEVHVDVIITTPDDLVLENVTVSSGSEVCYDAFYTITVAGNGSFFELQSGASAQFLAGESIRFLPGTHIQQGAHMHARIVTNNIFCTYKGDPDQDPDQDYELKRPDAIAEEDATDWCRVFPNPATGQVHVAINATESTVDAHVEVWSVMGGKIISSGFGGFDTYRFDVHDKPHGMYFVRVMRGNAVCVQRLIKH